MFSPLPTGTGAGLSPEAPRGGLEVYRADIPGRVPLCPVPAGGRGCTSWITTRRGSSTRTSMCGCSRTAAGSTSRIMRGTAISASLCPQIPQRSTVYFRKPVSQMQGKMEEIFCDDESRLEMMRRMFLGRYTAVIHHPCPADPAKPVPPAATSKEPDAPVLVVLFLILLAAYGWGVCLLCPPVLEGSSAGPGNKHRALPEKSRNNRPWFSRGGCHPFVRLLGGAAGGGESPSSKHANPRKNLGLTAFT